MGFSFNFFGESSHRGFNYKPRYYDPEEEERRRMFGEDKTTGKPVDGEGERSTESYIRGRFCDESHRRRVSASTRLQKIIGMVGLILFFVILIFIARFYGLILK